MVSLYSVLVVSLVVYVHSSYAGKLVKAKPITIGNCSCDGMELKDGSTQREFRMNCNKVSGTGKKKTKTWYTSCIYGGDPHPCAKYNKDQQKFYDGLLSSMANDYCSDTTLATNKCFENKSYYSNTICTDIPYAFNRYP